MKRLQILFLSSVLASLVVSCSATNRLSMGITEPAIVSLSPDVKRIGIINRSLPSEKNKNVDKIDQILSAEGKMLDKEGAQAAVDALFRALDRHVTFDEIKIIDDEAVKKGLAVLPAALSWDEIDRLCEEQQVDAIFSLALYDTDTRVSYNMTTLQLPNDLGIKVNVPAHELHLNTLIRNGWRIYDARDQFLADEFLCEGQVMVSGKGINPVKAYEAILNRKEAIMDRSAVLGENYSNRLIPTRRRIARDYFVRGSGNFEIAKRRAQAGDWQGAAELWELEVGNPKPKIAGRACYNMAIINEINGNLDAAVEWASRSYIDYRINDALRYLNILRFRQRQNNLLEEQLNSR
ncbi:DUF6340 family protein [Lentiprolixibacter aurantiacus]|uniref:DUF6340 family protein n=1 Tax=Lentiprolixibacter aurantiacus TaxID=2993939 RepID=A0AAE3MKX6_9FLAO|nr:DUF6340 family protein [Lentiprolixibacter aurantiacus]MCX2719660.1 DUF6340 family protein [Lentiprolixibacter aurantiacus]